jgi:hypothetical protein
VAHWTYEDKFDHASDLEQGDLLRPDDALRALFHEVHPHFCDLKYTGFLVATQSCDLVRRSGKPPDATYLTLAVIRPLAQVIDKLIGRVAKTAAPRLFLKNSKGEARNLLSRIFNQNEQALGLFFLHQDADVGIGEQSVALLRVAVAIRAEHYDTLIRARTGRLKPEFRAKLGWLIGNLYGRPATPDWTDQPEGRKKLDALVRSFVDNESPGSSGPRWIDNELVDLATRQGISVESVPESELEHLRPPPLHERASDVVRDELLKVDPDVDLGKVKTLVNRLNNSGTFKKLFPR